jgi:endonuclease III
MPTLAEALAILEQHYGPKQPTFPTDPYDFLIWWHCGYPASDAACNRGWQSLTAAIRTDPATLLHTSEAKLTTLLQPGGMVPELRARRLHEIAHRVLNQCSNDLRGALAASSLKDARLLLKSFPNIADPGADRILLFAGLAPLPAVPSNAPQVAVRIQLGAEHESYATTYREAQTLIDSQIPPHLDARTRAFLLLKHHGETLCKRTKPKCAACPLQPTCAYAQGHTRGRHTKL